jgi:hypothetical protein
MTPYEAEQTIIANIFAQHDDGATRRIQNHVNQTNLFL